MVFYRVLELAAGHDPVRYDDIRATRKPRSKPPQQRGTGHPPSLDRPAAARPWRTAEMQLQFPLRLSGYPGENYPAESCYQVLLARPLESGLEADPGSVAGDDFGLVAGCHLGAVKLRGREREGS